MTTAPIRLAMKIPIDDYHLLDLDAPVLPACEAVTDGVTVWLVWCKRCCLWHQRGPAEGHREAHCQDRASLYGKSRYNLSYAGGWSGKPPAQSRGL